LIRILTKSTDLHLANALIASETRLCWENFTKCEFGGVRGEINSRAGERRTFRNEAPTLERCSARPRPRHEALPHSKRNVRPLLPQRRTKKVSRFSGRSDHRIFFSQGRHSVGSKLVRYFLCASDSGISSSRA
jgi:hypothetical protein